MGKKNDVISTVEQLVSVTVNQAPWASDRRYSLRSWTGTEYDNPEDYEAWQEMRLGCAKYGTPEYYTWRELEPPSHPVEHYSLEGKYTSSIELSEDLGKKIEAIWTKRNRYGHSVPTGTMTLKGIVKRLGGVAEIEKLVNDSIKQAETRKGIMRRNNVRADIANRSVELLASIQREGAEIGLDDEGFVQWLAGVASKLEFEQAQF